MTAIGLQLMWIKCKINNNRNDCFIQRGEILKLHNQSRFPPKFTRISRRTSQLSLLHCSLLHGSKSSSTKLLALRRMIIRRVKNPRPHSMELCFGIQQQLSYAYILDPGGIHWRIHGIIYDWMILASQLWRMRECKRTAALIQKAAARVMVRVRS